MLLKLNQTQMARYVAQVVEHINRNNADILGEVQQLEDGVAGAMDGAAAARARLDALADALQARTCEGVCVRRYGEMRVCFIQKRGRGACGGSWRLHAHACGCACVDACACACVDAQASEARTAALVVAAEARLAAQLAAVAGTHGGVPPLVWVLLMPAYTIAALALVLAVARHPAVPHGRAMVTAAAGAAASTACPPAPPAAAPAATGVLAARALAPKPAASAPVSPGGRGSGAAYVQLAAGDQWLQLAQGKPACTGDSAVRLPTVSAPSGSAVSHERSVESAGLMAASPAGTLHARMATSRHRETGGSSRGGGGGGGGGGARRGGGGGCDQQQQCGDIGDVQRADVGAMPRHSHSEAPCSAVDGSMHRASEAVVLQVGSGSEQRCSDGGLREGSAGNCTGGEKQRSDGSLRQGSSGGEKQRGDGGLRQGSSGGEKQRRDGGLRQGSSGGMPHAHAGHGDMPRTVPPAAIHLSGKRGSKTKGKQAASAAATAAASVVATAAPGTTSAHAGSALGAVRVKRKAWGGPALVAVLVAVHVAAGAVLLALPWAGRPAVLQHAHQLAISVWRLRGSAWIAA
eukprot:365571-Chlamydomonas_euryale.AAC.3